MSCTACVLDVIDAIADELRDVKLILRTLPVSNGMLFPRHAIGPPNAAGASAELVGDVGVAADAIVADVGAAETSWPWTYWTRIVLDLCPCRCWKW